MTKPYCIGSDEWNGLSKMVEELGELQQVCGKLIGSEGDTDHWSGDLKQMLVEEIADVYAALDFFVDKNLPTEFHAITDRAISKVALFEKWDRETSDA